MSFELQQQLLVNSIFGFGHITKLPQEPAPEQLKQEEEQQPNNIPPPPPLPEENSIEDPLPFSNTLPFQKQASSIENPTVSPKKVPIIKKLSTDLKEALIIAKKLEKKYKFPYSNDERFVTIDLGHCVVHTQVKLISNVLFLLVKTFFGSRSYYLLIIPLNFSIEQLKQLIVEGIGQNPKMLHNVKLIHPITPLKEFKDMNEKISDLQLKDYSQLLFLAQMTFTWDPIKKGKSIVLSNNNLTTNKQGESDYQTVLGTLAINSGRHYWEIRIDKYVDEEDIFVGVARKEIDLYTQPTTTGHFYGYICLCARKFGIDGSIQNYGYSAKQNDVIGVLLEFRSGLGSLSFFRNGVKCGEAFNNLSGIFYPAISMFYGEVQVTLDPRAPLPPN